MKGSKNHVYTGMQGWKQYVFKELRGVVLLDWRSGEVGFAQIEEPSNYTEEFELYPLSIGELPNVLK